MSGGLILSDDFVTYTPTARSETSGYSINNITEKWHMLRRFRAADASANAYLIKLDFSTPTNISALFLRYVNFNSVIIQGNDSDVWTSPSYSETVTINLDEVTNKYSLTHLMTTFTYRYMRIYIPTGQTPLFDTVWSVGDVCCFGSYDELVRSMTRYKRSVELPYKDVVINGRITDRIKLGSQLKYMADIGFGERVYTYEDELFEINHYDCETPILLYENLDESEKGWLVLRNNFYGGTRARIVSTSDSVKFEEVGV